MQDPVFDQLISEIIKGIYKPGDRLPSENFLAEKYSLPRIRIRKSFDILEDLGYIYSQQGKGRFVRPKPYKMELAINGNESFTQKAKTKGINLKTFNVSSDKIEYDSKIYDYLNAEKNEQVFRIRLLRFIDKQPVALHSSYLRESLYPEINEQKSRISSMFQFFKNLGYKNLNSTKTIMSVTFPTAEEQELLCCPSLVPMILFESDTVDAKGQILQFSKILYRSDSFQYVINH